MNLPYQPQGCPDPLAMTDEEWLRRVHEGPCCSHPPEDPAQEKPLRFDRLVADN